VRYVDISKIDYDSPCSFLCLFQSGASYKLLTANYKIRYQNTACEGSHPLYIRYEFSDMKGCFIDHFHKRSWRVNMREFDPSLWVVSVSNEETRLKAIFSRDITKRLPLSVQVLLYLYAMFWFWSNSNFRPTTWTMIYRVGLHRYLYLSFDSEIIRVNKPS